MVARPERAGRPLGGWGTPRDGFGVYPTTSTTGRAVIWPMMVKPVRGMGRVDLGGCPPRSPTDPGLHITRTRFLIS